MKTKLLIIILIMLVTIISAFFALQNKTKNTDEAVAAYPHYSDLEIFPIHLTGIEDEFSLRKGELLKNGFLINNDSEEGKRALNLALFYQWMKEDPLLFDPNMEIDAFRRSLELMRKPNELLDRKTGWGYANPVSFLHAFLESSEVYGRFTQDISEENARNLISALYESAGEYGREVERVGKYFHESVSNGNGGATIMFFRQNGCKQQYRFK